MSVREPSPCGKVALQLSLRAQERIMAIIARFAGSDTNTGETAFSGTAEALAFWELCVTAVLFMLERQLGSCKELFGVYKPYICG